MIDAKYVLIAMVIMGGIWTFEQYVIEHNIKVLSNEVTETCTAKPDHSSYLRY